MSDQNAGDAAAQSAAGAEAPEASSGDGAAQSAPGTEAPNASDAGEQTQETPDTFDRDQGIHKKGYAKGRTKGKRERDAELAQELGVESIADLKKRWGDAQKQQEKQEHEVEVKETNALRTLRKENQDLKQRFDVRDRQANSLELRAAAMLQAEVKARLAGMGAIPGAVGDLAALASPDLDWAADAQSIEVFTIAEDEEGNRERQPSHESLDEYLKRIKELKPWAFADQTPSGSGKQHAPTNPRPDHAPTGQPRFTERLKNVLNRRE